MKYVRDQEMADITLNRIYVKECEDPFSKLSQTRLL